MWSVDEDSAEGRVTLRLSGHVTAEMMEGSVRALAAALHGRSDRWILDADLLEVTGFDARVPLVAAELFRPHVARVAHLRIRCRDRRVRVAAATAAAVIGLRFSWIEEGADGGEASPG
ncbi:MAG: hypothetical protein ACK4YP_19770, partial [Myxococcota bacterium]